MKKIKDTTKNPADFLMSILGGDNQGDAIERQEAQGQDELVQSDQLPAKINSYCDDNSAKDQYKKMGIKVIGESSDDGMFLDVTLPEGWKKEATDHSMWSKLVDDKGRVRASIFYKAAFYDRDAFINFEKRYYWSSDYKDDDTIVYYVYDAGTNERLFETKPIHKEYYKDKELDIENERLQNQCKKFLKKNFRKHDDINTYWD